MNPLAQLSCWIDPVEVVDVLIRIENGETALKRHTLCLQSTVLEGGSVAGFADMVTNYLSSFRVPASLITLTTVLHDCSDISSRARSALASLHFDGSIAIHARATVPPELPRDTVLSIECSAVVADLIEYPCRALLDMVDVCVDFWRSKQEVIESVQCVEFVPSGASRLQIAVDQLVASHFGAHVLAENFEPPRINQGYRALTVSGRPPIRQSLVDSVRQAADQIATTANVQRF